MPGVIPGGSVLSQVCDFVLDLLNFLDFGFIGVPGFLMGLGACSAMHTARGLPLAACASCVGLAAHGPGLGAFGSRAGARGLKQRRGHTGRIQGPARRAARRGARGVRGMRRLRQPPEFRTPRSKAKCPVKRGVRVLRNAAPCCGVRRVACGAQQGGVFSKAGRALDITRGSVWRALGLYVRCKMSSMLSVVRGSEIYIPITCQDLSRLRHNCFVLLV